MALSRVVLVVAAILASAGMIACAAVENVDYTQGSSRIRFLGKSPNFQVFPNTSLPSYLQLRFSKFEERDPTGKKVNGHSITSLAAATPTWTSGNYVASNGANLTFVRMLLDLVNDPTAAFSMSCPTNGNSGRRSLRDEQPAADRRSLLANPYVTVTLYFGGSNDSTFNYGFNKTVTVAKGGIKFSVQYDNWPFCNDNNTLGFEIDLMIKGDAAANASVSTSGDGTKVLSINLGNGTSSSIYFANYAYEAVNGNRSMPVSVDLTATGTQSTVTLKLPNPKPNTSVYYDPTVTTGTTADASGGAAAAARVSLWAALAALLLSALLA